MPSYIVIDTPIFGISIVPSSITGSGARSSVGGGSGFGSVGGVVLVDVVVLDVAVVELVVVVLVVVGTVVVLTAVVVDAGDEVADSGSTDTDSRAGDESFDSRAVA
jgi:hypothetical protein